MDFTENPTRKFHIEIGTLAFRGNIKNRQVDHSNVRLQPLHTQAIKKGFILEEKLHVAPLNVFHFPSFHNKYLSKKGIANIVLNVYIFSLICGALGDPSLKTRVHVSYGCDGAVSE